MNFVDFKLLLCFKAYNTLKMAFRMWSQEFGRF